MQVKGLAQLQKFYTLKQFKNGLLTRLNASSEVVIESTFIKTITFTSHALL